MGEAHLPNAEVHIAAHPRGTRALFIVETGSRARADALLAYLTTQPCRVRVITLGPVVAFAAWVPDGHEAVIAALMEHLRDRYPLSICEPGFTPSMYRAAIQLARDSEGELCALDHCDACGDLEPFPTQLVLRCGETTHVARYCPACEELARAGSSGALCRNLLRAAGEPFASWAGADLAELPGEAPTFALSQPLAPAHSAPGS